MHLRRGPEGSIVYKGVQRRRWRRGWQGGAWAAACLLSPASALAGAWSQEQGRTQIIFAATSMQAEARFGRGGRPLKTGRFSKQETAIQAERGLGSGLTLLAGGALRASSFDAASGRALSMSGAISAGLRTQLWSDGATILSLQGVATVGGERSRPSGLRAFDAPAEAEIRLLLGRNFSLLDRPGFAEAQVGYRWRGGRNADELVVDATLGIRPLPRLMVLLQSFNTVALQPDRRFGGGRMRRHKLQPSLVWELSESWSVQFGAFATLAGRETLQESGLVAALWWRF